MPQESDSPWRLLRGVLTNGVRIEGIKKVSTPTKVVSGMDHKTLERIRCTKTALLGNYKGFHVSVTRIYGEVACRSPARLTNYSRGEPMDSLHRI